MSGPLPICYLNGTYLPLAEARVSPLDRAFLFGDAVYEVIPVYGGRPFRLREHLDRLNRSLAAIRMSVPRSHPQWAEICSQLVERNAGQESYIYLQVSRGTEIGRNHAWPEGLAPTLFAYVTALEPTPAKLLDHGVAAVTAAEIRWARRDIKSTALLANILLKKMAADSGAFETIMIEDGELTEGSSTAVHVVVDGVIHAPPEGQLILPGTTRDVVAELAGRLGIACNDHRVPEALLRSADEIWLSFATRGILPVTCLDGVNVGSGKPGPLFKRMHAAFVDHVREVSGTAPL
ncbi:MAG: aminotransferase class IV [Pseudomonadota bacterium]|nr:aminotransferase class IV [Pseudomonadota bacterium]